jgi:hypothetical protein
MTNEAEQIAWEQTCPQPITSDVMWRLDAYRASLFLLHVAKADVRRLIASGSDKELNFATDSRRRIGEREHQRGLQ